MDRIEKQARAWAKRNINDWEWPEATDLSQLEVLVERAFKEEAECGRAIISDLTQKDILERVAQLEIICNNCLDTVYGQCTYHQEYQELEEKLNNL